MAPAENLAERGRPGAPGTSEGVEAPLQPGHGGDPLPEGGFECSFHRVEHSDSSEIDEGAGGVSAGYPLDLDDLEAGQVVASVHHASAEPDPTGDGDLRLVNPDAVEPPQSRRRPVRRHHVRPRPAPRRQLRPPVEEVRYAVDTRRQPRQAAHPAPVGGRRRAHSGRSEVGQGDQAVVLPGRGSEGQVRRCPGWRSHSRQCAERCDTRILTPRQPRGLIVGYEKGDVRVDKPTGKALGIG